MKVVAQICLALVCSLHTIVARTDHDKNSLSFRRISPVGGFTYGSINTIGEDSTGIIWFGTTHGLFSYNTREVRKFINDPADTLSLPNNSIRTIFCDASGRLWIGTSDGLCTYNQEKEKFVRKKLRSEKGEPFGDNVAEISHGKENEILMLSTTMLGRLNPDNDRFEEISVDNLSGELYSTAACDQQGKIWVGGVGGTIWAGSGSTQLTRFNGLRNEAISKIFPDESGIWVGYQWAGLDHFDLSGRLIAHYGNSPGDLNRIHHDRVRDVYKDESGRLWISTYKGLSIISSGRVTNLLPDDISGLPYISIYKIFTDSKKGIWIGTWSGGLAYKSNYDNYFIHSRKELPEFDADYEVVSSFAEKEDGTLFVGSEFGNLNRFDREKNQMVKLSLPTENGVRIENIKSLSYDKETGTLWVGTFIQGLWYLGRNEKVLRQVRNFNQPRISVYAIAESDSGLWLGTFGAGLFHYNTSSRKVLSFPSTENDNVIRSLLVTADRMIWIGTTTGLNRFDPSLKKFFRCNEENGYTNSPSADIISNLRQDNKGRIWMGTSGNGLYCLDPSGRSFETFTSRDGLAGDDVYGIAADENGVLWVSTDNGITCIDQERTGFRTFFRNDELQGNQFNPASVYRTSTGDILFGDTKGFTYFNPAEIKTNPYPPKVVFTSLSVNNITIDSYSEKGPLRSSLGTTVDLKLTYHQNSLVINFVATNFLLPGKNRFRYRLLNYDNNWVEAGSRNYATYTKIPPGRYVFEVLACNNDGLWNTLPKKLNITVTPPFWFSRYAYLSYIILLFGIILMVRRSVMERQRIKKELLLERLMHESEARVNKMKLQFFTNISHEFRTPLTLIIAPLNQLMEKFSPDQPVRQRLETIRKNANRLLQLINQLIDIHRIDEGKALFKGRITDLISIVRNVISYFELEAKDKKIQLSFLPESEKIDVLLDPEKADKIFFNILANALKFTPEKGAIQVVIYTTHSDELNIPDFTIGEKITGSMVCIEFSDNGPGVSENELTTIFERFGQGKNHKSSGTGIGLHMAYEYTCMHGGNISVRSNSGKGSTFRVCLPIVSAAAGSMMEENARAAEMVAEKAESELPGKEKTATILVIEDNYDLRQYIKNLLSPMYRTVTSSNGKQGLETSMTIIPDLVITDILMPQMDGFEVCRQIKNDIRTSHIPVILITALHDPEKQAGGFRTGADAYLTKPFDESVLLALVENLLRSRTKLRELYSVSDSEWVDGMEMLSVDRIFIEKASSFVEQHLNDKTFVIDHLSAYLGISTSSLYRKLKVLTNQSPTEFVRYLRLKKAVSLMQEGNTNIDEIGYAVGFNSHSYFSSSFKNHYGITPSEYISDIRGKKENKLPGR